MIILLSSWKMYEGHINIDSPGTKIIALSFIYVR